MTGESMLRTRSRSNHVVVRRCDLPSMQICTNDTGFTIYRGVIVCWDEDHDQRILDFIDNMKDCDRSFLVAVQEHEGSLSFRWSFKVPEGFEDGQCLLEPGGDYWSVYESFVIG